MWQITTLGPCHYLMWNILIYQVIMEPMYRAMFSSFDFKIPLHTDAIEMITAY